MRIVIGLVLIGGLAIGTAQGRDFDPRPGGLIRPAPVWTLRVQDRPLFPGDPQGEVSVPASRGGLSLTVQPEKKEFGAFGPLAFRVVLKNTSDGALTLMNADRLGGKIKLVIAHTKTGAQWTLESTDEKAGDAKRIAPGESLVMTLVVQQQAIRRPLPRPIPLPQPVPVNPVPEPGVRPLRGGLAVPDQPIAVAAVAGSDRSRPGAAPTGAAEGSAEPVDIAQNNHPDGVPPGRRPPMIAPDRLPAAIVPCGTGPCRVMIFIESPADPERREEASKIAAAPVWSGKLASQPVDFTIGEGGGVQPPVVIGPATKEDAVRLAIPAAEHALDAVYQPVPDIRPAHSGNWIAEPEKSADVTERREGGWTVRWTHSPRSGFLYNATVDVDRNGGTLVREAFAGYRPE